MERADLPDDSGALAEPEWITMHDPAPIRSVPGIEGVPTRRRAWLINIAAIVVALGVIMLGVGVDSPRSVLVIALLFGVPIVLVAITAAIAARRAR